MGRPSVRALAADAVARLRGPRPLTLREVGGLLSGWASARDVQVEQVGSFARAGHAFPDLAVVERARAILDRDRADARRRLHGWGPAEAEELTTLVDWLDAHLEERRGAA